jgi:hypothetical protein
MKLILRAILLCSLFALPGLPAFADGTTVNGTFVSQYMFRGARLGGPSFQPSVELDSGNFSYGIWANKPLYDRVSGQSDPEIDPWATYTWKVGGSDSFNIAPGFTFYDYPKADKTQGFYKSTFEPNIALNYTFRNGVRLTPKLYYDMTQKGLTYEFTATGATPLKTLGTELDWTAMGGTFTTKDYFNGAIPAEKNSGNYYLVGVKAPYAIKDSTLTLGVAYTKGSDNTIEHANFPTIDNPDAAGRTVITLSFGHTF